MALSPYNTTRGIGREFLVDVFGGFRKPPKTSVFSRAAPAAQAVYCLLAAVYFR